MSLWDRYERQLEINRAERESKRKSDYNAGPQSEDVTVRYDPTTGAMRPPAGYRRNTGQSRPRPRPTRAQGDSVVIAGKIRLAKGRFGVTAAFIDTGKHVVDPRTALTEIYKALIAARDAKKGTEQAGEPAKVTRGFLSREKKAK